MTKLASNVSEHVLPEYIPDNLGAPFKVVLKESVRQVIDAATGSVLQTIIPNPRGLLQSIAVTRLVWPRKLAGADIKFVRKSFKVKAIELAEMIGVTPEHLSRCESGERVLSPGVERYLRMALLLNHLKLPDLQDAEIEECDEIKELYSKYKAVLEKLKIVMHSMKIPAAYDAEDELCLVFRVRGKGQRKGDATKSEDDEDWSGEEHALAA